MKHPRSAGRALLKLALGLGVSALCLYLALRSVEWAQIGASLGQTRLSWLVIALVAGLAEALCRAARWHALAVAAKTVAFADVFWAMCIGFLANNVLPARLGELARVVALARRSGHKSSVRAGGAVCRAPASSTACNKLPVVLATLVCDRVADALTPPALIGLAVLLGTASGSLATKWTLISLPVVLLFALLLGVRARSGITRGVRRAFWFSERMGQTLASAADSFLYGIEQTARAGRLRWFGLWSLATLVVSLLPVYACVAAVGIALPLGPAVFVALAVFIGLSIPSAPANVGTLQLAFVYALSRYGVGSGAAVVASIWYHATQYVPATLLGLFGLARFSMSLRSLGPRANGDGLAVDAQLSPSTKARGKRA